MTDETKTFTCSYPFRGARWTFDIQAGDVEDAQERLKAISGWGRVDGEVVVRVGGRGALGRLWRWLSRD